MNVATDSNRNPHEPTEEGFCRLCRRVVIEVGHGRRKGKSGPPGNMNAFKHGLAAIQKRRDESITTE